MLGPTGVTVIQWLRTWPKQKTKTICLRIKTQKHLLLCWDFSVMGEIGWRSGEVVLVVMEEEKRSVVETFYDCVDLDLEENTFNGDKVGESSNDLL